MDSRLAPLVLDNQGFFAALSRMTWDYLRHLEGTDRPQEIEAKDFASMRQALDTVVRWCEPYLPAGLSKPLGTLSNDNRLTLLSWECQNAKRLIEGLEFVQIHSGISQDFQAAVEELWQTATEYLGSPPSDAKSIRNKDQALEAVCELENSLSNLVVSEKRKRNLVPSNSGGGDSTVQSRRGDDSPQTDDPRLEQQPPEHPLQCAPAPNRPDQLEQDMSEVNGPSKPLAEPNGNTKTLLERRALIKKYNALADAYGIHLLKEAVLFTPELRQGELANKYGYGRLPSVVYAPGSTHNCVSFLGPLDTPSDINPLKAAVQSSQKVSLIPPEVLVVIQRVVNRMRELNLVDMTDVDCWLADKYGHGLPEVIPLGGLAGLLEYGTRAEGKKAEGPAQLSETDADKEQQTSPAAPTAEITAGPRKKRSTERGEGRAKLIAALTEHHKYANGSCLNLEPIGNNELARQADVSPSTAKDFFDKEFGDPNHEGGLANYKLVCRNPGKLADSLKALNGEFAPHDLYGRRPPGEQEPDEDE